jgi:hypothetical protein
MRGHLTVTDVPSISNAINGRVASGRTAAKLRDSGALAIPVDTLGKNLADLGIRWEVAAAAPAERTTTKDAIRCRAS